MHSLSGRPLSSLENVTLRSEDISDISPSENGWSFAGQRTLSQLPRSVSNNDVEEICIADCNLIQGASVQYHMSFPDTVPVLPDDKR